MPATLFDHIKAITQTQDKKYWDKLDESDKKTFSSYMVFRFLSMNPEWVTTIAQLQPYLQEVPPKACYLALIDVIPKTRAFLKYMKAKGEDTYEKWLVELINKHYNTSTLESEEYVKILYSTKSGRERIKELCNMYGVETKQITKLKLNL
jgi:hypothetical protein